jgi:ABC-type sugar transport system ATPase subunit
MNEPQFALNKEVNEGSALRLHNISKIYPGTVALHNVNLDVKKGEVHGIIGKNGAGKSTLMGIIAGIIAPTGGEIFVGNKKFEALTRIVAKKEKISIVPQDPQVIMDFTVAENLFVADYTCRNGFLKWKELYSRAEEIIQKNNLHFNVRAKAADLSISERQLLLVLKACYVEEPSIIILDEASASLSQEDEKTLYRIIEERKKQGNTVLFISHRTDELLRVCDRVTVLRDGKSVATAKCADLDKAKLSSLIVGEDLQLITVSQGRFKPRKGGADQPVLSVENLTRLGIYQNITFDLHRGEILGLAGLRGSGRTELLKGIAGIEPVEDGLIRVENTSRRFTTPSQALRSGIVYLPEDREREGIISLLSVRENLVLNSLKRLSRGHLVNQRREKEFVSSIIDMFGIKTSSPEQEVAHLSGGNKQKVVVGRIASTQPKILLLDEPTKGVDISTRESILAITRDKLSETAGIILTSPGLEDLIQICDRILILYRGEIIDEFMREEFRESDLFYAVQGIKRPGIKSRILKTGTVN